MDRKLYVYPGVYFLAALWLLVLPSEWFMGVLMASCVHEMFHLLAVLACGGQVLSVSLTPTGARMVTTPLTPGREVLCAFAGPLGSISLLLIAEHFPEAALCGLAQGGYNLLPIYPLDGGRILRGLLPMAIGRAVEAFFVTLMTGIGIWITIHSREVGCIFLIALWIPVFQRKFSCKEPKLAVQ